MSESPRHRIYRLIRDFRDGRLSTEDFCSQFERTFNLELDKAELSEKEETAFSTLFEVVVWFSPFPEERMKVPNYRGEDDVSRAVAEAQIVLGGNGSEAER
jgi:hypothetical protein